MSLHASLQNTLHGSIKPFVTKCTLAAIEAQSLSTTPTSSGRPIRPPYLPPPTDLPLRHCSHKDDPESVVPEAECLLDILSGGALTARSVNPHSGKMAKNKEHWVLASADEGDVDSEGRISKKRKRGEDEVVDLRGLARQIPGVPVIYVKRSVMVLEELSGASLNTRRTSEKEKIGRARPGASTVNDTARVEDGDKEDEEEASNEETDGLGEPTKRKRRKGPKQPNPLSVKKKKSKSLKTEAVKPQVAQLSEPKEKKKRRRKHKGTGEQDGAKNAAESAG
ncbi:MAG: hypothetical protein Q9160_004942 [Pyrenula sp. 1 TL-2023]